VGAVEQTLSELLTPVVAGLGLEFVGLEYAPQGAYSLLRIYIDAPAGVTVEDCERVSHQVSGVLEVEDPIKSHYTLEVSSPGLDRPLFTPDHYARFAGERVKVRLRVPVEGRRNLTGVLTQVTDTGVTVDVEGVLVSVTFDQIDRARLVPEV
jgi:ribosome maturation factor RimP